MSISVKLALQIAIMFLVFCAVLFAPAGTISWPGGWVFLALFFGGTIALTIWLLRHNPELLQERMTGLGRADQKAWDKRLMMVMSFLFVVWLVVMPLDAVRFKWSYVPVWCQIFGGVLTLISSYLFFLTFRENSFLSPAVRIQKERGQSVIKTGPYAVVRHPLYAAFIIWLPGTCLLLGSLYGLLVGFAIVATMVRRTLLEEKTLIEELPGYREYMSEVRYRFVPHLW